MPRRSLLLFVFLPLLTASCYEDRIDCLDPDATNYDLRADEACPDDCCTYPTFSLDVERFWGEQAFSLTDTFTDGALNEFRIIRFRFYLSELELVAGETILPTPENIIEAGVISGTDTLLTELNTNLILASSSGSTTSSAGTLRTGTEALTQVQGLVGMSSVFNDVYPPSAPAASPLSTQVNLLNFNDGNGYLTASAEFILIATNDTVRVDVYDTAPLLLDFPTAVDPLRGSNITVELAADYQTAFGNVNLATEPERIGEFLAGMFTIIGVR